ncbi:hypothetical protein ALTERO38_60351 [Alteromonas sp. 38]|nr:hypothetical protein ALTER154_40443 [Alteromonas sp. 154]VXC18714.1 hypothetical protein ALTERO38_60351 [Alteromonas sp. 38]
MLGPGVTVLIKAKVASAKSNEISMVVPFSNLLFKPISDS